MIEVGKCELDIKRQLMQFYANANTLIRVFGKCSNDVKLSYFIPIVQRYTVEFSGMKLQCEILVDFFLVNW